MFLLALGSSIVPKPPQQLLAANEEGEGEAAPNKEVLFSSKADVGAWKQVGFGPSTREGGCES